MEQNAYIPAVYLFYSLYNHCIFYLYNSKIKLLVYFLLHSGSDFSIKWHPQMKNIFFILACMTSFASKNVYASLISFDSTIYGTTSFSRLADDGSFTATFSNPTRENGSPIFVDGASSGGIWIGSYLTTFSFDVVFDKDVIWNSYNLFYQSGRDYGVGVSGTNVSISNLFIGANLGLNSFQNPLSFFANEVYTFTSNNSCSRNICGSYIVNNWSFSLANVDNNDQKNDIPEPLSISLFCLGLIAMRRFCNS